MKLELSEIFQKDIDQAQETFNSLNQLTPMVMYLLAVVIGTTLRNYINFHLEEKSDKPLQTLWICSPEWGVAPRTSPNSILRLTIQTNYPKSPFEARLWRLFFYIPYTGCVVRR